MAQRLDQRTAKQHVQRTGEVVWRGWEIWATYDGQGRYTGAYRMAPARQREHWSDYNHLDSLSAMLRYAWEHPLDDAPGA